MVFCSECGSSSRDSAGFCRGCGASMSSREVVEPDGPPKPMGVKDSFGASATNHPLIDLVQPQSKNIWVAALLPLLVGPLGMCYSTVLGGLIMFAVYVFSVIFCGKWATLIVFPVCSLWAALAARD